MNSFDAVVIGGGLAGIAAAERLSTAGLNVALIEARQRFGGRVWTLHEPDIDYPIELGAEWFDNSGEIHGLLSGTRGAARESSGKFLRKVHGEYRSIDEPDDGWIELRNRLAALEGPDRSLDSALNECCTEPRFADAAENLRQYAAGFHAADPRQLSLEWLRVVEKNQSAGDSGTRARWGLNTAVDALLARIGASCTVYLGTTVDRVRWSEGKVSLDCHDATTHATLDAHAAIVTLPNSILRLSADTEGSVQFAPSLASKEQALDLLATGPVIKISCLFDAPFWRDNPKLEKALFIQDPTQPIPTWWTTRPIDTPLLVGWVAGSMVQRLNAFDTQDLLRTAMCSLAHALDLPDRKITARLRRWWWHNWQRDTCSQGAYSWVRVGGIDAHKALAAPIERTLFFAGEATCGDGYNATMDGAIQSGWRAADELLESGA